MVYEGEFKDDKFNGKGKLTRNNGEFYEGEFKEDKMCGRGKYNWPSGQVYEGEWKDDNKNGRGKQTWPSGQVCEGEWKDGVFQKSNDFQKLVTKANQKPNFQRYKNALLTIVTINKDNYPIYQFITPFIPKLKSNSFRYFYEALQLPQRRCDWVISINNVVSEAESGNNYLTEMLELIISKFSI